MKLTCQQESLKKALAQTNRAVATKSPLPILLNVSLSTHEGRLCLKATDLEIGITALIGARVEVEGGITVPAKLFSALIDKLPPEKVTLTVENLVLKIECGRFSANLKGITASDYPPIPTVKEGALPLLTIPPDMLRQGLEQVVFAAATDESRPVLTGVLFRFEPSDDDDEGDIITLAAADGFRMSVRKLELPSDSINRAELRKADPNTKELFTEQEEEIGSMVDEEEDDVGEVKRALALAGIKTVPTDESDFGDPEDIEDDGSDESDFGDPEDSDESDYNNGGVKEAPVVATPFGLIVPGKTCGTLIPLLKECEDDVEVFVTDSGNQVVFKSTLIEIIGQLIDGKFPDFERIIPTEYTTRSLMETSELIKAVKLAALFAVISQNIVKLVATPGNDVSPGKLVISANAAELGDNTGEVDGIVHGEEGKVATNVKYLLDALNAIGTAQVAIEQQTPQSPIAFKPVGNSKLLQVVMPMSIRE